MPARFPQQYAVNEASRNVWTVDNSSSGMVADPSLCLLDWIDAGPCAI